MLTSNAFLSTCKLSILEEIKFFVQFHCLGGELKRLCIKSTGFLTNIPSKIEINTNWTGCLLPCDQWFLQFRRYAKKEEALLVALRPDWETTVCRVVVSISWLMNTRVLYAPVNHSGPFKTSELKNHWMINGGFLWRRCVSPKRASKSLRPLPTFLCQDKIKLRQFLSEMMFWVLEWRFANLI